MKKIRSLVFLLLLFITSSVIAQNKQITGKVINKETGAPLEGLSVMADKTTQGVVTKADGSYSISVKTGTTSLVFSFVGFETKVVSIGAKKNIDVEMTVAVAEGSEVVVVGYGTQKKSSLTGAIAKFKNEKLDEAPVARLDQALQGKIAGVQIQNVSSEAGAAPKISIRGISSLNAGSSPLIVIDGMPVPDGLSFLNPGDVESIEVLKDAASAAIYGSRGASGVIMVTTKKGSVSKTKYNFKFASGQKKDYMRYDIMTTKEYVGMLFDEMKARSSDPNVVQSTNTVIDADRTSYIIETQLLRGQSTDWQSESLRPGSFKNIQLNASGGSKDVRYFVSGGYQNDEGMMNKSNYEKFNVRTKVDVDFSK
jgi:TonB-linked SusC/RagA family outer membrane protein